MFPAREMHTFAVNLALQILRDINVFPNIVNDELKVVESKLHQHWLENNRVEYIEELRRMCETPENRPLNLPDRLCPSVEQALIPIRDSVEDRMKIYLPLMEAKQIADIVWANAELE